jgi:hypothetical protein
MKNWLIVAAVAFISLVGAAQSQQPGVTVIGAVTPGHCTSFASTLQLQDAGAACGGTGVSVTSVFGRMGVVVAQPNDYTLTQIAPGTVAATGGTIASSAITGGTIASTAITGGTINNTAITGGNIDGTVIGGTTRAAGSFTSVAITTPLPVTSGGTGESGTAWTTFAPAPACGTAIFTVNSAKYKTIGKVTHINVDLAITSIGTCTGAAVLNLTLPVSSNSTALFPGFEYGGFNVAFACNALGAVMVLNCLSSSALSVNSHTIITGTYENQ